MTTAPKTAMQIKASRSVDDRSVLTRSTEAKPDTADGVNERIRLGGVNLAAHAPDIDVDDVGGGIEMQVPNVLQQHGPRYDLAFVAGQIFQQLELARQQVDVATATAHRAGHEIKLEIADAQDRFLHHRCAATRERLDARQQFGKRERFDQIIVAAGAQAAHFVVN